MTTALQRLDPARRERLVLLAAEEFATHGLASASLNRVLAAAGMSKSSFYHLLASKQDLFDLAVGDLAAAVAAELAEIGRASCRERGAAREPAVPASTRSGAVTNWTRDTR